MSACGWNEDGRHRYIFAVSRMAGTPYYGCGPSCPVALPTGDGVAEDAAFLAEVGGVLVAACAGCDLEVEVGDGEEGYIIELPSGFAVVCLACGPDEADALAELEAMLAERWVGDLA